VSVATNGNSVVGVPAAPTAESRIYRCEYCKGVVLSTHVAKFGGCKECGSRKVRLAFKLTEEEVTAAKAEGYNFNDDQWSDDPEYVLND
jgi:hypothetical protein